MKVFHAALAKKNTTRAILGDEKEMLLSNCMHYCLADALRTKNGLLAQRKKNNVYSSANVCTCRKTW